VAGSAIEFRNVSKSFGSVHALRGVDLDIRPGEFVVVVGPSGAGKTTLIRSVNGLVRPDGGHVLVDGEEVSGARGRRLRRLRTEIGMIFQNHNLVRRSSVLRNVLAGRLGHAGTLRSLVGLFPREDKALALESLERLGIGEKAYNRADELSGGQQQRVSIARALTQKPKLILADEPVASLDPPTAHAVMRDLKRINREDGITTVVNLHFVDMAMEYGERLIGMRGGEVVFDGPVREASEKTFERIYGRSIREEDLQDAESGVV
jgi:phosphonate transport system ATP-binding protein